MKIGITGGIGSGKTYISDYFAQLGIPIYNSDIWAKKLMNTDARLKQQIVQKFGKESFINDNLNTSFLSKIVFSDKQKLQQLNNIVHPILFNHFEQWYLQNNTNVPYVIQEAAILIENGNHERFDKIILVVADINVKIKRIQQRSGLSEEQITQRINNQLPDDEKIKYVDFVITNNEDSDIQTQVKQIHNTLINKI